MYVNYIMLQFNLVEMLLYVTDIERNIFIEKSGKSRSRLREANARSGTAQGYLCVIPRLCRYLDGLIFGISAARL